MVPMHLSSVLMRELLYCNNLFRKFTGEPRSWTLLCQYASIKNANPSKTNTNFLAVLDELLLNA